MFGKKERGWEVRRRAVRGKVSIGEEVFLFSEVIVDTTMLMMIMRVVH
jgi:uncharacterized protein YheU (UPF0270 family)